MKDRWFWLNLQSAQLVIALVMLVRGAIFFFPNFVENTYFLNQPVYAPMVQISPNQNIWGAVYIFSALLFLWTWMKPNGFIGRLEAGLPLAALIVFQTLMFVSGAYFAPITYTFIVFMAFILWSGLQLVLIELRVKEWTQKSKIKSPTTELYWQLPPGSSIASSKAPYIKRKGISGWSQRNLRQIRKLVNG